MKKLLDFREAPTPVSMCLMFPILPLSISYKSESIRNLRFVHAMEIHGVMEEFRQGEKNQHGIEGIFIFSITLHEPLNTRTSINSYLIMTTFQHTLHKHTPAIMHTTVVDPGGGGGGGGGGMGTGDTCPPFILK